MRPERLLLDAQRLASQVDTLIYFVNLGLNSERPFNPEFFSGLVGEVVKTSNLLTSRYGNCPKNKS